MSHKVRRLCFACGWLIGLFGLMLPIVLAANLGDLDPDFGQDGVLFLSVENGSSLNDLAIQADGKIVAVGYSYNASADEFDILLIRCKENGALLDEAFGNNGLVNSIAGFGTGVAIQPDGKIVVAGRGENSTLLVARYVQTGSLDSQFGHNGIVTTTFTDTLGDVDVALDTENNIVAVTTTGDDPSQLTLIQYTSGGNIDSSFATNGMAFINMGSEVDVRGKRLTVQPDGQILVVGDYFDSTDFSSVPLLARYDKTGHLDNAFGNSGLVTSTVSDQANGNDLTLQPDGKIVVTGSSWDGYTTNRLLLRYNADGSPDDTFINDQVLVITDEDTIGQAVALQPGGKIVVAGPQRLTRHNADGSLDLTFGAQGVVELIENDYAGGKATAIQADGRVLVAGEVGEGWAQGFITRYIGDLPPTFPTNNPATGSPLITPTQGVSLTTARPPFDWEDATDDVSVTHYTLQLTPSNQALTLQESTAYTTPVSNYTPTADLANGSYTWTVQAHDLVGHVTSILTPAHFTIAVEEQDDTERVYLPLVLK